MYLLSLATASPRNTYTQQDCFNIFADSEARKRLKQRSVTIMEKVLLRDNGIHSRRFSYPDVETIFDAGPEKLNNVFEKEAPALGSDALRSAMDKAKLSPSDVDVLVVCTCTGYLCPGLSSFIAEQTGLKPNCELSDLVGMGCGAAIPSLRTAHHRLQANPELKVAVVAVEICSAAFYLDDDPGVIISACLFGDGAAATIWSGTPPPFPTWEAGLFDSLHIPGNRQLLRFENAGGALRNRLSRRVPEEAAAAVQSLFEHSVKMEQSTTAARILPHTGGRDVLDALGEKFDGNPFPDSRSILRDFGNMSSPSILFVLDAHIKGNSDTTGGRLWLTSFGAGFSAYGCTLRRT
jgi:predicted naringenin-chalcone synthase